MILSGEVKVSKLRRETSEQWHPPDPVHFPFYPCITQKKERNFFICMLTSTQLQIFKNVQDLILV